MDTETRRADEKTTQRAWLERVRHFVVRRSNDRVILGLAGGIADRLGVPIRFIGVGEGVDDLRPFDADEFVKALFE